jgi:hypothetical protein
MLWSNPVWYYGKVPAFSRGEAVLNEFLIGCDPEFGLLSANGAKINAALHFPDYHAPIGCDHNGRLAEFHPEPKKGILPIIHHLQDMMKDAKLTAIPKVRAGAIFGTDALGGHIHFGFRCFPEYINNGDTRNGDELNARGAKTTKALDALTKTLEHLDILPAQQSAQRRAHVHGYGRFGDVRDCDGHMEYRTMASWLYDPKVAFLCLTAAKLAACDPGGTLDALKNCDSFAKFEKWISQYKSKDRNAARASEKLLDKGLKFLQIDPEVDFRGRWEHLGL